MRILINVTDRNVNSGKFSVSKELVLAHAQGLVYEICLYNRDTHLWSFKGKTKIDKAIGSALANGRIYPRGSDNVDDFYYLASRFAD